MTREAWVAGALGLVVGLVIGYRAGVYYLPSLIGRMTAFALRGDIKKYRRRRRLGHLGGIRDV